MQMKNSKKLLSFILCMALIVAMALSAGGCGGKDSGTPAAPEVTDNTASVPENEAPAPVESGSKIFLGEGSKTFDFTVTDADGVESQFEIHTDKETVGDALLELDLIAGDESEYGLYVKTVNGITADFDTDGVYWAFYVNGEYAMTGVDATDVEEGSTYSFKVEK